MAKHFGCTRFVYNYFLNERNQFYLNHKEDEKKSLNYYDNAKSLTGLKKTEEYIWLKEVNSQSVQQSLRHLDVSYNRFFNKISKFPKFKSKYGKQSFTVPQNFSLEESKVYLPKFKEGIEINLHRKVEGKMLFLTIKKNPTGKYFVCITVEKEIDELPLINKEIGIDLGLKNFLIDSDGNKIDNPKFYRKAEKALIYEQRQLSKKKKDSTSRNKQKLKVARVHEKIKNSRKNFLHQISSEIIKKNQIICLESLQVKNMVKNHKLAKSISDVGWGTFVNMLNYKAQWYGRIVSQIERFYPSSKLCNNCDLINESLALRDRIWTCECGTIHDRDINAARNILRQGLNLVAGLGTNSVKKQMEASTLVESMKPEALCFS